MLKVRKDDPKKLKLIKAKSGVPPEQLKCAQATRKTTNRLKTQYRLVLEDGTVREFRNFDELRFFSSRNLRNCPTFMKIEREGGTVTPTKYFTFHA